MHLLPYEKHTQSYVNQTVLYQQMQDRPHRVTEVIYWLLAIVTSFQTFRVLCLQSSQVHKDIIFSIYIQNRKWTVLRFCWKIELVFNVKRRFKSSKIWFLKAIEKKPRTIWIEIHASRCLERFHRNAVDEQRHCGQMMIFLEMLDALDKQFSKRRDAEKNEQSTGNMTHSSTFLKSQNKLNRKRNAKNCSVSEQLKRTSHLLEEALLALMFYN